MLLRGYAPAGGSASRIMGLRNEGLGVQGLGVVSGFGVYSVTYNRTC